MDLNQIEDIIYLPVVSYNGYTMLLWDMGSRTITGCDDHMQLLWPDLILSGIYYKAIFKLVWEPDAKFPATMVTQPPLGRIVAVDGPGFAERFPDVDPGWYQNNLYFFSKGEWKQNEDE